MRSSDPQFDTLLQAIADPTRRRILQALKTIPAKPGTKTNGLCASDIEGRIRLSQPTVSHHLKKLREAGIVGSERQGLWAYYYVIPDSLEEFSTWLS